MAAKRLTRRAVLAGGAGILAGGLLVDPARAQAIAASAGLTDEDGYQLWLRYPPVQPTGLLADYRELLTHVVDPGPDEILQSAAGELTTGLSGLLDRTVPTKPRPSGAGAIVLGTPDTSAYVTKSAELDRLGPEGYLLRRTKIAGQQAIVIASTGQRGVLYGAFHLLRLVQTHAKIADYSERPANQLRLANHWDNLDRTVERGYAGASIFHWDELPNKRQRYTDYARALASIGMNGAVVNNVNAQADFLSSTLIEGLAGLAAVFRRWGVRLFLSANFGAPIALDGLETADPFDERVKQWWRDKATEIYAAIPDFGGFLVKANSEGQPGPIDYGRTHADGANLIADAVRPHGGIVMWRAFIHSFNPPTWAHESYDTFQPLDGKFADNVILQMKNGPIDFQVREPIHPLFGALPNTNSMLELEVTQEYTGHSTHLCYLVPEWKQVYAFDTQAKGTGTTVASIVDGSAYGYSHSGVAGVMNFGEDINWTGYHLGAANTHGYGRLAWNPRLDAHDIAEEWVRMTFGSDSRLVEPLIRTLLTSWETYENYTSPLGCGFMIGDGDHYEPGPAGNEPWHHSDAEGTGFDRTVASGDGDTQLWRPPVAATFDSLATCPDELLLFFQHVPYGHQLRSGSTVIQHIYDSHFDGQATAVGFGAQWQQLRPYVDARRHGEIADTFAHQADHAAVWRDALVGYFFETSKILDEKRAWAQVRFDRTDTLVSGAVNQVPLVVGNASASGGSFVVGTVPPQGWDTTPVTVDMPVRGIQTVSVPVMPHDPSPGVAYLVAALDAGDMQVLGGSATRTGARVLLSPAAHLCALALDGGTTSSPLFEQYTRLSPTDVWDETKGYGWVGGAPQSRDRGPGQDPLVRDFVNDNTARVLRITVPAGVHDTYVLVADNNTMYPTYVRSGGELLAASELIPGGGSVWLHFALDGGSGGRPVDLELSSIPAQHWHLGALIMLP